MGNYDEAKRFNGMGSPWVDVHDVCCNVGLALLLEKEPTNLQAQSLSSLIDRGVARGESFHRSFRFHI
jgi:hypothetical protein